MSVGSGRNGLSLGYSERYTSSVISYLRLSNYELEEALMTWRQEIYRSTKRNSWWGFLRVHLWSVTQFNGGPIGEWGTLGIFLSGLLGPEIKIEFNINNTLTTT